VKFYRSIRARRQATWRQLPPIGGFLPLKTDSGRARATVVFCLAPETSRTVE